MTLPRTTIRKLTLLAALAVVLPAGCGDDDAAARRGDGGPAQLKAEPNPLPPGSGAGTTTLTWRTGESGTAQLYVSVDGRPEKKVAEGHKGSKQVDWIHAGRDYQFKLYAGEDRQKVLAQVAVRKPETAGASAGASAGAPAARPQPSSAAQRPAGAAPPAGPERAGATSTQ